MSENKSIKLSVIIPTLNEEQNILSILEYLIKHTEGKLVEFIVVDADSKDQTVELARSKQVKVIETKQASRAHQMNEGVKVAVGDILYFVHADVKPPRSFYEDIIQYTDRGYSFGCYRFKFDSSHPLLYVNSLFTRFKFLWCRGGDQTLFIKKSVFLSNGGFDENYVIMEDFELIKRLWNKYKFKVIPKSTIVSARKYEHNTYFEVNWANLKVFRMFQKGVEPKKLQETYYEMIRHPKDL